MFATSCKKKQSKQNEKKYIMSFHLQLLTLKGTYVTLDVDFDEPIDSIKKRIEAQEGIPVEKQRIIFGGKMLESGKLFCDYNYQKKDSTWYLVIQD